MSAHHPIAIASSHVRIGLLAVFVLMLAGVAAAAVPNRTLPAPAHQSTSRHAAAHWTHAHHRWRAVARTAVDPNAGARSFPRSDAYINATLYYDYEPGRLYEVETSPHFLTAILLRPGEKLLAKAAGDTVRWVLGETAEGVGASQQVVVLVKPIRGGLRTNIVLTTDQRTYLIEAGSREGGAYTSAVSWNYPQEQMQTLAAQATADATTVVAPALAIDQLHFGYKIAPVHGKSAHWQPIRVFDDGLKTYIQFPVNMASTDAPPLFLVGPADTAQLVNYRYINGYYVVDRLFDVAELRLGEKPQVVVRITRAKVQG
jgi:type IV secretion system protein TrbG